MYNLGVIIIQELGESTTTISSQLYSQQSQDKGKGIYIEPTYKRESWKEKEANIALIETWDDIQAKIDADHQLAERLQAQEQEELSIKEKATLFQQLLEKRRKHFAAKRAEEKRNKPPTKAQQRKIMCTYLKNMEGYKLKDLKFKEFDSIQEMFDRAFKRVNTFEDFRTELVEGKEKRAGTELIQENAKKQKVEDDKETAELKQCLEIIPDEEEVTIDAIPLAVKEDLEDLYKLVKARYGSTRPVESMDYLLWNDMKIMFEPHVEDEGRIVGIKSLLDAVRITVAQVYVNTALMKIMNQEEIQQAAREDTWVPKADRSTTFYKAFLATTNVPEIYMQQFWHTVTKVKESTFYEFKLENKKCLADVEVFRQALDICPRVPGKEFVVPPSEEELLTFLIGLGIGKDVQEYGRAIPNAMLTDNIKQYETYQMFIIYSTSLIPPKKTRASRKSTGSQPHDGGSSKGTGTKPGVPDQSIVILKTLSEGTGAKPWVPNKEKETFAAKADVILDWGSKNESDYSEEENVYEEIDWVYSDKEDEKKDDDKSINIEETDDEETDDEFVQESENGDEEITDTSKADAEKTEEVKDDNKKAELPPSSSSLSASSGIGNKFLYLSSDKSTVRNLKDSTDAEIISLLDVQIQKEIPHILSPSILNVPVFAHVPQQTTPIPSPPITTVAPAITTMPNPLPAIIQRVYVLEKDVQKLKEVDHTKIHLALLRSKILSVVNAYLGSSLGDALQKSVQANIINEVKNLLPKFLPKAISDFSTLVIQSTVKKALEKTLIVLAQSSSQAKSSLKAA
ncbi:hypothetical protein Tco_0828893 [Tanacetum coccineum]